MRWTALALVTLAAMTACGSARAGEGEVRLATSGVLSSWRGDYGACGTLQVGYRFGDLASVFLSGREGYATVDERLLTLLALGGQVWGRLGPTRPYARLALLHQHEEPVASAKNDIGGVVFGVGDGIRHRAGGELGGGLDVTLYTEKKVELFGYGEASALWFPDPRGPTWFGLAGLGLGLHYAM